MWKLPVQVLFLMLLGISNIRGSTLQKDNESDLESRLTRVEELLANHIESKESLRVALRQEIATRVVLETQLTKSLEEQRTQIDDLSSVLQVANDRVVALDGTIQEEIRLREEAEVKAEEVILQLSRKISLVERDLSLFSLLNSRLRDLEDQKGVQNEEILDVQNTIAQLRRSAMRERRDVQQARDSTERLAFIVSEHTKALTNYDNRISQMKSWLISQNETVMDEGAILREVKTDVLQLTESLMDIDASVKNLTESVNHLHHITPTRLLKLCPEGYRKVGEDCLQLIETRTSWEIARLQCEELGIKAGGIGDLAVPTNLSDFRAYVAKIDSHSDYLWVGANRDVEGIWKWITGMSLEVPWDLGEPDNYEDQIHLCVKSDGNIKFHDCIADSKIGAICQLV